MRYEIHNIEAVEMVENVLQELGLPHQYMEDPMSLERIVEIDSALLERNGVNIEEELMIVLASIDHMYAGEDENE
jgi:hypothetical protein